MSDEDPDDDKGFLARWSQRKREARQPDRDPPAARGKKITRSASRGTSAKLFTSSASRRPSVVSVGTAAHIPASSSRLNASINARSSSATSTSPSASTISPWPGFMRRSFIAIRL